jgi:hypothetical protein
MLHFNRSVIDPSGKTRGTVHGATREIFNGDGFQSKPFTGLASAGLMRCLMDIKELN